MARADLLKELFLAYQRGENEKFKEISLLIIKDERKKNHNILADQLYKIICSNNTYYNNNFKWFSNFTNSSSLPKDDSNEAQLVEIKKPKRNLNDLITSDENILILKEIIEEFWQSDNLKAHNLKPKNKLLFCGPPGCGKTLSAEVIANELQLPIAYCRFDAIISSYLGDTASNIRKVFEFAQKDTWVILFDEFDAIGKSRNDPNEHGELKRVINSFLQILDSFDGNSIIIACTNHEGLLDNAIWRRFDDVIYFDKPLERDIPVLIKKKTLGFPTGNLGIENYSKELLGMSYSDIERICQDAIKLCILRDADKLYNSIFEEAISRQKKRISVYKNGSVE